MKTLDWLRAGSERLRAVVAALPDEAFAAPSLLPGWDRATVVAHVARNADALGNLVAWARTGVETPMYPSAEARAAGIAELAARPAPEIRAEFLASDDRLISALGDVPWDATVRTARGRPIPAAEIPWMRNREVWVHAVDLDAGVTFADLPPDVLVALLDDAVALMPSADVTAHANDVGRTWHFGAPNAPVVAADLADLCAWALGRAEHPDRPTLPPWL
jgi:maleylpyruvate isomerase